MRNNTSKKINKHEKKYRKAYMNLQDFINNHTKNEVYNYSNDELRALRQTDNASYQRYRRLVKTVEDMETKNIVSKNFIDEIHQEALNTRDTEEEQVIIEQQQQQNEQQYELNNISNNQQSTNNIENQRIENEDIQQESQERDIGYYDRYCENCLRKQSQHLEEKFSAIYTIEFILRRSDEISQRTKFRRIRSSSSHIRTFWLCKECDCYLVSELDNKKASSSINMWPSFIWSTLTNIKVIDTYGYTVWKLIPTPWRYWWIDNIHLFQHEYSNVTIDYPEPIIVDRSIEVEEWNSDMNSQLLPRIASSCNKYMIPNILCPWGCTEFIFRCGHISLDIVFQRFLQKVNIQLIHNTDVMKYVKYCRDDYIRFDDDYGCWLFNSKWKVKPSICYVDGRGMAFMVCKDHNNGCSQAYVHPPRQPNHILPCKYSDQLCHAVIKPRTITQQKAKKYSNTFQMHEQRGNFNGIDTCSVTQYRNFNMISYLLQEYESRSIYGRPDINALLDEFVKEKLIPKEFAESYCNTARSKMDGSDMNKMSYGATYVPAKITIQMQQENNYVKVL